MSSKLSYLSKYSSSPLVSVQDDHEGKKKSKKKPRSEKKKKRKHAKGDGSTRIRDIDELGVPPVEDAAEGEEEDEGPVVVKPDGFESVALVGGRERAGSVDKGDNGEIMVGSRQRRKKRHDSDSDDSFPRVRRRTHESEDEDNYPARKRRNRDERTRWRGEEGSEEDQRHKHRRGEPPGPDDGDPSRRRRRHDSDDESHPPRRRRFRHDSDDAESEEEPSDRKDRYSNSHSHNSRLGARGRRRMHDSDDEPNGDRNKDFGGTKQGAKMSSGHDAGLQDASKFREAEAALRKRLRADAAAIAGSEGQSETVYRDKHGRKLDMLDEFMRQRTAKEGRASADEREQAEWGKGRVQKEAEEALQKERRDIKTQPFARREDDNALESLRKETIREGDPMAGRARKKQARKMVQTGESAKPLYKGPAPKPNRFGIRPGYRWDGVDRGNGFEDKVLAKQYSTNRKKEDAYRWSSADM